MKWFLPLIFSLGVGCASKRPVADFDSRPPAGEQLFSFPGSCSHGVLSPEGRRIAALCILDDQPRAAQIYEFDLPNETYRRVTWQDGRIESVDWLTEDRLVYDSNTDEIKEAPFAGLSGDQVGSEIYSSDRFGMGILRWTNRNGQDNQVATARGDGRLLFVSRRGSSLIVFIRDETGAFRPVSSLTANRKFSPALIRRQAAWLEPVEGSEGLVTMTLQGRDSPARWTGKQLRSLRSVRDGWILSEVNSAKTGSSVWFVKADLSCEKLLWMGQESVAFADASSNPSQLALTFLERGRQRLSVRKLANDSFACVSESSPLK